MHGTEVRIGRSMPLLWYPAVHRSCPILSPLYGNIGRLRPPRPRDARFVIVVALAGIVAARAA